MQLIIKNMISEVQNVLLSWKGAGPGSSSPSVPATPRSFIRDVIHAMAFTEGVDDELATALEIFSDDIKEGRVG
nr:hypothetical protein [Candidatus Sigynarchaeota archaeon]